VSDILLEERFSKPLYKLVMITVDPVCFDWQVSLVLVTSVQRVSQMKFAVLFLSLWLQPEFFGNRRRYDIAVVRYYLNNIN